MSKETELPPAPQGEALHDDLYWDAFWFRNRTKILLVAGIVVIAGTVIFGWMALSASNAHSAATKLATASDLAAYEAIAKDYPRTPAGADALIRVAALQRDAGKFAESTSAFEQFVKQFPKHSLIGGARLGIGQNAAASGDTKLALATFREVVAKDPASYAAPFALYAAAEIHLREFQRDEARVLLQEISTAHPTSYVARLASMQLSAMGSGEAVVAPQ